MSNKRKYQIGIVLIITLLGIIGISYAYWMFTIHQTDKNVVTSKCFEVKILKAGKGITLEDAHPVTDEEGKEQEGYTFTIKNICNSLAYYQVNLEEIVLGAEAKKLSSQYIKVSLNDSKGKILSEYSEVDPTIKEEGVKTDKSHKLTSDSLEPEEEKEYTLKLWMADSTPAIDEVMNATFESKVSVIASYKEASELENEILVTSQSESEEYSKDSEIIDIIGKSENYNIIEYSLDNEKWNSVNKEGKEVTVKETFETEGTYPFYFKDEVGNIEETSIETKMLDQTSPIIEIEETSDENGAVLNITFNDEKSGLYEYKIEDEVSTIDIEEGWTPLEEANTQTIQYHSNVNKPIHIYVKDRLDNESNQEFIITKADTKAPEITYSVKEQEPGENDWYKKLTLEVSLTDDISGVKEASYCIAKGEESCNPTTQATLTEDKFEVTLENNSLEQKVCTKAIDALNNESEVTCSDSYKVDTEKPSQKITLGENTPGTADSGWYKEVTIHVTVSDSGSGISTAQYCIGKSGTDCDPNTQASVTSNAFNVELGTDANSQKVCVNVTDNAGITSETSCSGAYNVDNSLPTAAIKTVTESATSITIDATTSIDSGSQIALYTFKAEGGGTVKTGTSTTGTYTFSSLNRLTSYTITVTVQDKAGNLSTNNASKASYTTDTAISALQNMSKVTSGVGLYQVTHSEMSNAQFNNTELRYAGKDPSNYVTFNGETWRIIGLVNVMVNGNKVEQRIKLVKKDYYSTNIVWDSNDTNNWTTSSLQSTLNTTYYNTMQTAAKNMIDENVTWNLGGSSTYNDVTTATFYTRERGTTVYTGRPTTWTGKIGLMYPSDYGYATSGGSTTNRTACLNKELYKWNSSIDCKNNAWLYDSNYTQWTLIPRSSNSNYVFLVNAVGAVSNDHVTYGRAARPVVYLKTTVKITGGDGSSGNPYVLSL